MTRPPRPEITPYMVALFAEYYLRYPAWGSMHIVLDDFNLQNSSVDSCIEWAIEQGDNEGWMLAQILRGLSKGQRHRLGEAAERLSRLTNTPLLDHLTGETP